MTIEAPAGHSVRAHWIGWLTPLFVAGPLGALLGSGFDGSPGLWALEFTALLLVLVIAGTVSPITEASVPLGVLIPVTLAATLLGAWAGIGPAPHWLLAIAGALLLVAAAATRWVLRERVHSRERARAAAAVEARLRDEAVEVSGLVVEVSRPSEGWTANEAQPFRLEIDFRRADGTSAHATHTEYRPRYARPRLGAAARIRYVPDDPSIQAITLADEETSDAVPHSTVEDLATLAHLHATGALTDDEFATAKARILHGG
ncbi:SHOCT domain-containing protein [Embleya sp. NPDC005971]|uniref:SHOCT domain-containing protein n=1 Tax=Embleya sp. NPDC005971 TaxID=3156724 RepID=UPI0033E05D3D